MSHYYNLRNLGPSEALATSGVQNDEKTKKKNQ